MVKRAFSVSVFIGVTACLSLPTTSLAADDTQMNEIKLQRLVRGYVEGALKDPESAQFRNQYGLCGEVNAKNAYGGYVGYRRFIAASEDKVFMEDDQRLEPGAFDAVWTEICASSPSGATKPR